MVRSGGRIRVLHQGLCLLAFWAPLSTSGVWVSFSSSSRILHQIGTPFGRFFSETSSLLTRGWPTDFWVQDLRSERGLIADNTMWVCAQPRHAQLACPSGVPSSLFFYLGFSLSLRLPGILGWLGMISWNSGVFFLLSWIDQDWFRIVAGRTIHRKLGLVRGKGGL